MNHSEVLHYGRELDADGSMQTLSTAKAPLVIAAARGVMDVPLALFDVVCTSVLQATIE